MPDLSKMYKLFRKPPKDISDSYFGPLMQQFWLDFGVENFIWLKNMYWVSDEEV
jgi:hypothetical protein